MTISAESLKAAKLTDEQILRVLNEALGRCEIQAAEAVGIANECGLNVNQALVLS